MIKKILKIVYIVDLILAIVLTSSIFITNGAALDILPLASFCTVLLFILSVINIVTYWKNKPVSKLDKTIKIISWFLVILFSVYTLFTLIKSFYYQSDMEIKPPVI